MTGPVCRGAALALLLCVFASAAPAGAESVGRQSDDAETGAPADFPETADSFSGGRKTGAPREPSYLVPAVEIAVFNVGMWGVALLAGMDWAYITSDSVSSNFSNGWTYDDDNFWVNLSGHPYQGGVYHGISRTCGLGFWTSAAYTFGGSLMWELLFETQAPSINDQIMSSVGGVFFGESLHRLSALILEGGGERPGFARRAAATLVSIPDAFNGRVLGYPSGGETPSYASRISAGATLRRAESTSPSESPLGSAEVRPRVAVEVVYGIPGVARFSPRPFDHFNFQLSADFASEPALTILARGLLAGGEIRGGGASGVWGLYGVYDYRSARPVRVSAAGAGFGFEIRSRSLGDTVLDGTALVGLAAMGGAGENPPVNERDYLLGPGALAILEAGAAFGGRTLLRLSYCPYFIAGRVWPGGTEVAGVASASATVRVAGRHAVALEGEYNHRSAQRDDGSEERSSAGAVRLCWALVGGQPFAPGGD